MAVRISLATSKLALRGLLGMVCLLAMLVAERSCQASCGDYVILKGSHAAMPEQESSRIPLPKVPCNGPVCRGEIPTVPPPPAPTGESPTEKPLALFGLSLELDGSSPGRNWPASQGHARPGFRFPLERPPII